MVFISPGFKKNSVTLRQTGQQTDWQTDTHTHAKKYADTLRYKVDDTMVFIIFPFWQSKCVYCTNNNTMAVFFSKHRTLNFNMYYHILLGLHAHVSILDHSVVWSFTKPLLIVYRVWKRKGGEKMFYISGQGGKTMNAYLISGCETWIYEYKILKSGLVKEVYKLKAIIELPPRQRQKGWKTHWTCPIKRIISQLAEGSL